MAKIEVDINNDRLAEAGYTAFREAQYNTSVLRSVPWDIANAEMRNFWREWARQFTIAHMTGG